MKVFIQDHFDGMPCPKCANVKPEHGVLIDYTKVCISFQVGKVYYQVIDNKLKAFKVLGWFVVGASETVLHTQHPDGSIWYTTIRCGTSKPFFRSVDDYYRFVEGDNSAKVDIIFWKLTSVMPTEHLLQIRPSFSNMRFGSRKYYVFDAGRQIPVEHNGYIMKMYFDGQDWFVQSSAHMDRPMTNDDTEYFTSKADCIKANIVGEVVDFDTETPPRVDVKVEIKVTPPEPKVRKITIIEEA